MRHPRCALAQLAAQVGQAAEVAEKTEAGRVAPIRAQFPGITVLSMVSNLLFNLFI